jgi:3-oxoacyl-[acyl-carrier-protein] synthase II
MGVISSLGQQIEPFWQALLAGQSGIRDLTFFDTTEYPCKIGGEIREFNPEDYIPKKEARRMDRFTQLAMSAARMAYEDAGLTSDNVEADRFGVVVGTGAGGIGTIEDQVFEMQRKNTVKCNPFSVPMMLCNMGAGRIAIEFNAKGPSTAVITACSTGTDSVGTALRMIQNDEADVVIAGASEAPLTGLSFAGFCAARALSFRDGDPTTVSRPFDAERDGFVMSEGAGILILEDYEHAKARGAKIYGEVTGYGRSTDAIDLVRPPADGSGLAVAMRSALRNAGISPDDIAYINAHATSTPLGDAAETNAIKQIFGDRAMSGQLLVSGTKSMTGHLLGASGALESIICVLTLRDQKAPPTINLESPDPQCDLDYIPNTARDLSNARYVMSSSAGFGGHNAVLIFGQSLN